VWLVASIYLDFQGWQIRSYCYEASTDVEKSGIFDQITETLARTRAFDAIVELVKTQALQKMNQSRVWSCC
jgi:hypothetical protein